MTSSELYLIYALQAWEGDLMSEKVNLAQAMKTETSEMQYLVLSNDMFHVDMALHRINSIITETYLIDED